MLLNTTFVAIGAELYYNLLYYPNVFTNGSLNNVFVGIYSLTFVVVNVLSCSNYCYINEYKYLEGICIPVNYLGYSKNLDTT